MITFYKFNISTSFFPIFSNKFVFYVENLTNIITYILKIITELLEYLFIFKYPNIDLWRSKKKF